MAPAINNAWLPGEAHEEGAWVREAAIAYAEKQRKKQEKAVA